ncbi:MAG: hypothetical protein ACFCU1_14475 [Sumerlaeia bacterium]
MGWLDSQKYKNNGEIQNVMRHCIWQCCLANSYGDGVAKQFGDAHEVHSEAFPNTDERDIAADLHNNNIGRRLGCERSKHR